MKEYLDLLKYVMKNGVDSEDRTGVGTRSVFGYQTRYNLEEGFPAVTTKKLALNSVVAELLWMLSGSTDERRLAELTYGMPRIKLKDKRTIWTDNCDHQGKEKRLRNDHLVKDIGPLYGYNWRNWMGYDGVVYDQMKMLVKSLKEEPYSRRHILSVWNVPLLDRGVLPPCHVMAQFYVRRGKLSCLMFQRSADLFLGVPFNVAFYAMLTHLLAIECGYGVGELVHTIGDAHIYKNHFDQVKEQIKRKPMEKPFFTTYGDFNLSDYLDGKDYGLTSRNMFDLVGYDHHPPIKAPMAV